MLSSQPVSQNDQPVPSERVSESAETYVSSSFIQTKTRGVSHASRGSTAVGGTEIPWVLQELLQIYFPPIV